MNSEAACRQLSRSWVRVAIILLTALLFISSFAVYFLFEKNIEIIIDGKSRYVLTRDCSVERVLAAEGITIGANDKVLPAFGGRVLDGGTIQITRAVEMTIRADGEEIRISHIPATTREILAAADVSLGEKDLVNMELEAIVTGEEPIVVSRVTTRVASFTQPIDYQVERIPDETLEKGISKVITPGRDGREQLTVEVSYADGKEIQRVELASSVLEEPVNQVIAMGTLTQASRGGRAFEFNEAMVVEATAYTYTGNRTATGTNPKVGTIAVDPRVIPLGSRVYVEGYGFATAEDTGGAIKGNIIDVFLETEHACRSWGRKQVKIYMLD